MIETALASLAIFAFSHFNTLPSSSELYLAVEDSERIILHTARYSTQVGIPLWGGLLLLCASIAIIASTGNSFLLTPSTNLTRDIYQRFINPQADIKFMVTFQRIMILLLGIMAYLLLTQFTSILAMALTAYTMVGAGLTPALMAAFLWKRVTVAGGVASIAAGMGVTLLITIANFVLTHHTGQPLLDEQYIILPAISISVAVLILVSLATPPDSESKWKMFQSKDASLASAINEK